MISAASIATRHGTFVAQFNHTGLCQLDFPGKAASPPTGSPKRWLEATALALGAPDGFGPRRAGATTLRARSQTA